MPPDVPPTPPLTSALPLPEKPKRKLPIWLKVILIILAVIGGLFLAAVLFLVYLFAGAGASNHAAKAKILTEVNQLTAAPGCHEASREYQDASIDTQGTWSLTFNCASAEAGPTYDSLTAMFGARGYHLNSGQDFVTQGPNYFYSFVETNPTYSASVDFRYGDSNDQHSSTNLDTLKNEEISGYTLSVTQAL